MVYLPISRVKYVNCFIWLLIIVIISAVLMPVIDRFGKWLEQKISVNEVKENENISRKDENISSGGASQIH